MAFFGKMGKLLKNSAAKQINYGVSLVFQATRSMSSGKLFVEGLSYRTDENSLRKHFARYGEVLDAKIIKDRETGRSRGFGYVTFATTKEASAALQTINISLQAMKNQDPNGWRVRVNYARERLRPGEFCAYSVPSSYHGSHFKTSYAADGEISISKGGPLHDDYKVSIMNSDLKLLDALKSISEVTCGTDDIIKWVSNMVEFNMDKSKAKTNKAYTKTSKL